MCREATQETARPGEGPNSALPTAEEVEGTPGGTVRAKGESREDGTLSRPGQPSPRARSWKASWVGVPSPEQLRAAHRLEDAKVPGSAPGNASDSGLEPGGKDREQRASSRSLRAERQCWARLRETTGVPAQVAGDAGDSRGEERKGRQGEVGRGGRL